MNIIYNRSLFVAILGWICFSGCKEKQFTLGELKAPLSLTINTSIEGQDASNPNGIGTGNVTIIATATNALTYNIDYGDGVTEVVSSGTVTHKYTNPGTSDYTVTVNAIGTGGITSSISKRITVFVDFTIPANILQALTGGSSKIWVTDKESPGHFGVGPADQFEPIWYAATPNSRQPCAYDDEITFTKDANNRVFMNVDNKGESFSIGASTNFYGFSGGDACLPIVTGGNKLLAFLAANSGSTASNSTLIQFRVPGNGIINFGTGGTAYEILSCSDTQIHLRNIGSDGNSWYQKLKPKP